MSIIVIYTDTITPRLKYVCEFIFHDFFRLSCEFVCQKENLTSEKLCINYTEQKIPGSFHVRPAGLLSKSGIHPITPEVQKGQAYSFIFPAKEGDFPFDLFAAVFYLISRYEEYLPLPKDQYGRFKAKSGILHHLTEPEIPLVNVWILHFASLLKKKWPELKIEKPTPCFFPTVDIDNPWLYLHKPWYRNVPGLIKDWVIPSAYKLNCRLSVLTGKEKDPFDSYARIQQLHGKDLLIFYLMGSRSKRDNKIKSTNKAWRSLIKELSQKYKTGIHPSYKSNKVSSLLGKEKRCLDFITGREITKSRQHFLKLSFPQTYRNLLTWDIEQDYSLGYAEQPGYRAGTNIPFRFYDLENETQTRLRIFPFTLMDRSLKDYLKLTPEQAMEKITCMINLTKEYGGLFISIWHNESLGTHPEWDGWEAVYLHLLREGNQLNNPTLAYNYD